MLASLSDTLEVPSLIGSQLATDPSCSHLMGMWRSNDVWERPVKPDPILAHHDQYSFGLHLLFPQK